MEILDILSLLVPNVYTAITQLCATAILFVLMYKLAWKPVKKILDTRADFEQSKLDDASKTAEENNRLNQEAKSYIDTAKVKAEEIVENAKKESETLRNDIVEQGRKEASNYIAKAQADIARQKDHMIAEIHDQIVDVAISATEKMLQAKIDDQKDIDSIDQFIKEVSK